MPERTRYCEFVEQGSDLEFKRCLMRSSVRYCLVVPSTGTGAVSWDALNRLYQMGEESGVFIAFTGTHIGALPFHAP